MNIPFWHSGKWIVLFWLRRSIILIIIVSWLSRRLGSWLGLLLGSWLDLLLGRLGLLLLLLLHLAVLLGVELEGLDGQLGLTGHSLELWLVDHGQVPTSDVAERLTEGLIGDILEGQQEVASDGHISKRQALADEERASLQRIVQELEDLLELLLGSGHIRRRGVD